MKTQLMIALVLVPGIAMLVISGCTDKEPAQAKDDSKISETESSSIAVAQPETMTNGEGLQLDEPWLRDVVNSTGDFRFKVSMNDSVFECWTLAKKGRGIYYLVFKDGAFLKAVNTPANRFKLVTLPDGTRVNTTVPMNPIVLAQSTINQAAVPSSEFVDFVKATPIQHSNLPPAAQALIMARHAMDNGQDEQDGGQLKLDGLTIGRPMKDLPEISNAREVGTVVDRTFYLVDVLDQELLASTNDSGVVTGFFGSGYSDLDFLLSRSEEDGN